MKLKEKYRLLFEEYEDFKDKFIDYILLDDTFPDQMIQCDWIPDMHRRVAQKKAKLSKIQIKIALHFYNHPEELNLTVKELGKKMRINKGCFSNFAQKLGYNGFSELRKHNFSENNDQRDYWERGE